MTIRNLQFSNLLALSVLTLNACTKDDAADAKTNLRVYLTDAPADYEAFYLDVKEVQVNMNGKNWITLGAVRQGTYDLVRYSNGLDTMLANSVIGIGNITQMQIVLGNNNSVVIGGTRYPVTVPEGMQNVIRANTNMWTESGLTYKIWMDVDLARSLVAGGDGQYILKPSMRVYTKAGTSRLKGLLKPSAASGVVYAIHGNDTFAAIPNRTNSYFSIQGLPPGNYDLWFKSGNSGYKDKTMTTVYAPADTVTDLGTVTLEP